MIVSPVIEPHLPTDVRGVERADDRRVISGFCSIPGSEASLTEFIRKRGINGTETLSLYPHPYAAAFDAAVAALPL
jgi:hypothetical protein